MQQTRKGRRKGRAELLVHAEWKVSERNALAHLMSSGFVSIALCGVGMVSASVQKMQPAPDGHPRCGMCRDIATDTDGDLPVFW